MVSHRRWIPPVVVVAVIAAGAMVTGAQAQVELPDKTVAEVLALAGGANVDTLSGTIEMRSDLGLPSLGGSRPHGENGPLSLLTGDHRLRVWLAGADRQRLQVLDRLAETNVVRNGDDLWIYQSRDNRAAYVTLPSGRADGAAPRVPDHLDLPATPDDLASRFLDLAKESTVVTVGSDMEVSGRPAYGLLLRPRAAETLVKEVSIAIDAETGLPLRLAVEAVGQDRPAFEITYTSLSLERPAESVFEFTPPPGAEVEEHQAPLPDAGGDHSRWRGGIRTPGLDHEIRTSGQGWATVLELPAQDSRLPVQLTEAMQPVSGGAVLRTALVSVLLTDDGRLLVGAVPPEVLQAAARS